MYCNQAIAGYEYLMYRLRLKKFQVDNCRIEDLQRLCKYLNIDPSTDGKRSSLVNWLIYQGYVDSPEYGGWRYL